MWHRAAKAGLLSPPLSPSPLRANVLHMISTSPESVSFGERFSLESKNIPSLFTKIWQYTELKKKIIVTTDSGSFRLKEIQPTGV